MVSNWFGKSVLVISPAPTYPRDHGNRLRIARICERLKQEGAHIHFVLYPAEADWRTSVPFQAMRSMSEEYDSFHLVPATRPLFTGPSGPYHLCDEWWDPAIGTYLDWLTKLHKFDAVIVNYTWLTRAFHHVAKDCLKILDTHDRFSGRKELFIANGLEPEFFYMSEVEEQTALNRADVVWAIKREEAEFFRSITDKPVLPVPHIDPLKPIPTPPSELLRVGLLGANNNINRANFEKFLDDAVAFVERTLCQFEIVIAGSICRALRPRDEKFIHFQGFVESTDSFYEGVDVVAIPMSFSTGLKIKTAEALAAGKPVLSLEHAFEGFIPAHDFHKLHDNRSLLKAIDRLTRDQTLLENLARSSAEVVRLVDAEIREGLTATSMKLPSQVRESCMIVVNFAEMEKVPLIADHVFETADYLRNLHPITFVATGDLPMRKDLVDQAKQYGSIVVGYDPAELTDAIKLGSGIPNVSWDEISASCLGLWVTTLEGSRLSPLVRSRPVIVSIDCVRMANALYRKREFSALLAAFQQLGGRVVGAASSIENVSLLRLASLCDRVILLPFIRATYHAKYFRMVDGLRRVQGAINLIDSTSAASGVQLSGLLPIHADSDDAAAYLMSHFMSHGVPERISVVGNQLNSIATELCLRLNTEIEFTDGPTGGEVRKLVRSDVSEALQSDAGWAKVWAIFAAPAALADMSDMIDETATEDHYIGVAESTVVAPIQEAFVAAPGINAPGGIGFHRIAPTGTLFGGDFYFSQVLVYLISPDVTELFDAMLFNVRFAGRDYDRIAIRFSAFEGNWMLTLRKEDSSSMVFNDDASSWSRDDWGHFASYFITRAGLIGSDYNRLKGADAQLVAECLNAMATLADQIEGSLSGTVQSLWRDLRMVLFGVPEYYNGLAQTASA